MEKKGHDRAITFWDTSSGQKLFSIPNAHSDRIRTLTVSPDGSKLFSAGDDKAVTSWGSATCTALTACGYGEYESTAPTPTTDRGCSPCEAGTCQDAADAATSADGEGTTATLKSYLLASSLAALACA